MNAAVTTGVYADLAKAAESMVPMGSRIEPDPDKKEIYENKYMAFQEVEMAFGK